MKISNKRLIIKKYNQFIYKTWTKKQILFSIVILKCDFRFNPSRYLINNSFNDCYYNLEIILKNLISLIEDFFNMIHKQDIIDDIINIYNSTNQKNRYNNIRNYLKYNKIDFHS